MDLINRYHRLYADQYRLRNDAAMVICYDAAKYEELMQQAKQAETEANTLRQIIWPDIGIMTDILL